MIDIGNTIKSGRISKNISLEQASHDLKISVNVLKSFEDNKKLDHYDYIYYIGHLRAYSNFLELNSNQIIQTYKEQISFKKNELTEKIAKPSIQHNYFTIQKFFSASLILIIFSSFYLLFVQEKNTSPEYALVPDLPESYIPSIEQANLNSQNEKNINIKEINETSKYISPSSAVASANIENIDQNKKITLKLLNSTWVQLRDNKNNIIFSKLMEKDEEYTYDINLKYNITAGNAGNIIVVIDQEVRGKIGKYGEIVDSITLDSNFHN